VIPLPAGLSMITKPVLLSSTPVSQKATKLFWPLRYNDWEMYNKNCMRKIECYTASCINCRLDLLFSLNPLHQPQAWEDPFSPEARPPQYCLLLPSPTLLSTLSLCCYHILRSHKKRFFTAEVSDRVGLESRIATKST
jgi:hypothetical protein